MLDTTSGFFMQKKLCNIHMSYINLWIISDQVDRRPLSPASLAKCDELLQRMGQYYKTHGININNTYADFDKHHIGVVTESQVLKTTQKVINLLCFYHLNSKYNKTQLNTLRSSSNCCNFQSTCFYRKLIKLV